MWRNSNQNNSKETPFPCSAAFNELLGRDKTFSIHHKNIQSLAIKIYKFINGPFPEIMSTVSHLKENS